MVILTLSKDKSKEVVEHINTLDTEDARQEYVQRVYNKETRVKVVNPAKANNGNFNFKLEDGNSCEGHVRLNGHKKKKLYLTQDLAYTIELIRLRCDDKHICQTVFLNLIIPYCRVFVGDAAVIISTFMRGISGKASVFQDARFSHAFEFGIFRKWEQWKELLHYGTLPNVMDVDSILELSISSPMDHARMLLQLKGHVSAVIVA